MYCRIEHYHVVLHLILLSLKLCLLTVLDASECLFVCKLLTEIVYIVSTEKGTILNAVLKMLENFLDKWF